MAGGRLKTVTKNKGSGLKNVAVRVGIGIGVIASACYLYVTHGRREIQGSVFPPDPVWAQFVNVALIFFVAIYTATMLRKGLCLLLARRKRG